MDYAKKALECHYEWQGKIEVNARAKVNDKESLLELINPQQKDITISIGDENYKPQAKDCSIISAEYSFGNRPIGTIGLIGPRRINYSKVIAIMAEVVKELNNILNNQKL